MNDKTPEDTATRRKRLRFRSWHRGLRETDLLLGSFADKHLADFGDAELDLYEALLEENDPDVFAWLTGSKSPPEVHDTPVLKLIQNFKFSRATD